MFNIVGWDIGGANVKAAILAYEGGETKTICVASHPFEIWREKERLPEVLQTILAEIAPDSAPQAMAVTMTAELADIFVTKREGVLFVLDSLLASFPYYPIYALSLSGEFAPLADARSRPLDFAAANWLATALWIARQNRDCLVVDVGSTTTDILPILNSRVCAKGRTDLERLISGELVYTGILRTNLAAIVQSVPVSGRFSRVSSEYFAISGDMNLILGRLNPDDYTCPTPDGRPPTLESARQRLARLVCADMEMVSPDEIDEIARYVFEQQVRQISEAVLQVFSRLPALRDLPMCALGAGRFLAVEVARRLGIENIDLSISENQQFSEVAPCYAAGYLLAEQLESKSW
jgi:probable H4MPT-linked C1 transfer pathway protein